MLAVIDEIGAACCFEAALELGAMVFDIVAWRKSRPNRVARKEARLAGEPLPPMSGWAKVFVLFLAVVIVLVAIRVAVVVSRWQS